MDDFESLGPELTEEDRRFVNELGERDRIAQEVIEKGPSLWERVRLFWNDTRERLGINGSVQRVEISGGVGDVLAVSLGGRDLGNFLPSGVVFRGCRYSKEGRSDYDLPFPDPCYDPYTKEVCLVIDKEKGLKGRLTGDLKYSGLIVLHEIGHAIDDSRRRSRFEEIERRSLLASTLSRSADGLRWFSKLHFDVIKGGRNFDPERIKEDIEGHVRFRIEERLEGSGRYSLRQRLKAGGIDEDQFVEEVENELTGFLFSKYKKAADLARRESSAEAKALFNKAIERKVEEYLEEKEEALSDERAKSERQAWAHALLLARQLAQESGVRLWDKDLESLFLFVDKLINAHGLRAGRKGVKNPNSRRILYLPD